MKKNKYNVDNTKKGKASRTVNGHLFMSKKESERYRELLKLEKEGAISELELQPKFILQLGFVDAMGEKHREIAYIADFRYQDNKTKEIIVEDVKGMKTDIYKIKKKLLLYAYQDFRFIES
jgi:hypothetical protein